MAKVENLKLTTGRGELWYVTIAGQGKKNYNEDGYEYTATLRADKKDPVAVDLKKQIDDYYTENSNSKLTARSKGYRDVMKLSDPNDPESEKVPTGEIDFQFKTKTTFQNKKTGEDQTKQIGVFNSKGAKVSLGSKKVGNGTEGAISGQAGYYTDGKKEDGVSLYLNNIQIFKFIEYVDNGGFTNTDEDGWTGEDASEFTGEPEPEAEAPAKTTASSKPRL